MSNVRLVDLNPRWQQNIPLASGIFTGLIYKCPNTGRLHTVDFNPIIDPYGIPQELLDRIATARQGRLIWNRQGDTFDNLTLNPSISQACCHITILNGVVILT